MLTHVEKDLQTYYRNKQEDDTSWAWKTLTLLILGFSFVLFLAFTSSGCASSNKATKVPTYEEAKKQVLAQGNLVDAPVELKYDFLKGGQKGAVKSGTSVTIWDTKDPNSTVSIKWGAVVLSDKKVAELQAIKVQRDQLRSELEAERLQARTKSIIYQASLEAAREANQRSWWEKNQGIIALATGGTLGAALIIGIVYALTKGNGVTVNTNSMLLVKPGVR